ncbi:MAG: hypothetical protein IJ482_04190, partial [Alphaproteobacteria bacterium]|nr:hypothetical protein [Alphaproteobacteria bacterium]
MSQLKKFLLLALSIVVLTKLAYAGISNIADTAFSSSSNLLRSSSSGTASDTGHTSTSEGVTCGDVTASTEEGCNAALGISSGAVATPCDGGLYTCTLPVSAYADNPACDSGAKATAAECTKQGATAVACGTEGKYNCVCGANYTKTCNSANNEFPAPGDACTNSQNQTYIPDSAECLSNCKASAGYSAAVENKDDVGECSGNVIQCWSNSAGGYMWQCDASCATMGQKYPQYRQSSGDCSEYNGEPVPDLTCGGGTSLCQCNTGKYMSNFDALPSCTLPQRPMTDDACVAENKKNDDGSYEIGNKYQQACGYPLCQSTDMTMMNLVYCDTSGWHKTVGGGNISSTPLSGDYYSLDSACSENNAASGIYAGGTEDGYWCTIPNNSACNAISNIILQRVRVCSCADTYKYVPADTTFSAAQIEELGVSKCGAGEVPLSLTSKDDTAKAVCIWNAQTSIRSDDSGKTGVNGKSSAVDASRFRYGVDAGTETGCLRKCESWEEGIPEMTGDNCGDDGLVMQSCAASAGSDSSFGASIPLYYKHTYCSCPRDSEGNNLYHDSCTDGKYLGGKTCTVNGTTLYQYCL